MFRTSLFTAIRATLVLTVLTGMAYPALATSIAQIAFPDQANGSLIRRGGVVVGSALIAQPFTMPHYFHPRPSAAGDGYDATASGGTNAGPLAAGLTETLASRAAALDVAPGEIPSDMVTASGSGLDPHISPANAAAQVARVASARAIPEAELQRLLGDATEHPQLGIFGERRLNVLTLNLILDSLHPMP